MPPTIRTQVLQKEPLAWIDDKKAAEIFRKRLSNQPSRLLEAVVVKGKSELTNLLHRPSFGIRPSYSFNIEKDSLESIGSVGALLDRDAPSIGRNVETYSETKTNVKTKTVLYSIDGRVVDEATALSYPLSAVFSVNANKKRMYFSTVSIITRADIARMLPMLYKVPGTIVEKRMGFVLAREFYSPQYDTPKPPNSPTDNRTTIYWNPVVKTDKNGKATISFYTSDEKTTFRVRMEGIIPTGKIGVGKYNIN